MTRNDIISMAREAGMEQDGLMFYSPYDDEFDVHIDHLEAFTKLVAAAEREACAKVCDEMAEEAIKDFEPTCYVNYYRKKAAVIRARGQE